MENVVTLPSDSLNEKTRFKYSNLSCELLTCDVNQLIEGIMNNDEIINKLYSFIESEDSLNPLLASYFARVMGCLIKKKSESVASFFSFWHFYKFF